MENREPAAIITAHFCNLAHLRVVGIRFERFSKLAIL